MSTVDVANLQPAEVFRHFTAISRIPRGSHHEKRVSDHLVAFARDRGLEWERDAVLNVTVRKPATSGCEDAPGVILQAHMDMVWAKTEDSDLNLETDGVRLVTDGDRLGADGTTLGADNGIGVAYILALLEASDIRHPSIEALFTVEEETGMHGALACDVSGLRGKYFINIDSEEEGILYASCCGGVTVRVELPLEKWDARFLVDAEERRFYRLEVSGLRGGHSGAEIDKQRGNANRLLARALCDLFQRHDTHLAGWSGGHVDNAIPVFSAAILSIRENDLEAARRRVAEIADIFRHELHAADGKTGSDGKSYSVQLEITPTDPLEEVYSTPTAQKILALASLLPDGVAAMDLDMPGLVETSANLAIIQETDAGLAFTVSVRSSLASKREFLCGQIDILARMIGAKTSHSSAYPAWEYSPDSKLRRIFREAHRNVYGREATIAGIHAGLECGVFSDHFRQLGRHVDMISFGPDITGAHTPDECLSIASTGRIWTLVKEALALLCR